MDDVLHKLAQLHDGTPVLVAAYDAFDRLRYANAAFSAAFFVDAGAEPLWSELMKTNYEAGRGTVIRDGNIDAWLISTQSRRGKVGFRAFETDLADGRWLWMTETVQPDGWMLCIASDITGLRTEGRRVRQDRDFAIKAAYTDELTGVANRRFVTARIEDMIGRVPGGDGLVGCVSVMDLDHFKYVNDRYGHHAGDQILRDFARLVQGQVRRSDCFGRVGGEEFLLVMPDTVVEEGVLIVERMLSTIRMSRPLVERPDVSYTFSAGIAAGKAGDTLSDLYSRADRALYSAKMAGRNRIQCEDVVPDQAAVG